jgi:hypothetical protein
MRKLPPCCEEFHNRTATDSVTVRIINLHLKLHLKMTSTLSNSGISQAGPFGKGLSSDEARQRLAEFGPNEPAAIQRATLVKQLLLLFANPLVIILLIASLVSAMIGDVVNASIIVVIVLLSSALNFTQTARSQRTAERLRKEVAPTATALRDGDWRVIPRRELVPGDLIQLVAGDLIPADARLVESRDLHVQQAALTGESLPVEFSVANGPRSKRCGRYSLDGLARITRPGLPGDLCRERYGDGASGGHRAGDRFRQNRRAVGGESS